MRRVGAVLTVLIGALASAPAGAELVILSGGRVLKGAAVDLREDEERLRVELSGGGYLTLPRSLVEQVVPDEVLPPAPPAPTPAILLRWAAGQGAPQTPYGELILAAARRNSLNPDLVAAMVRAESAFDPWAVSAKGSLGLLQLQPDTAARFGVAVEHLFDPAWNLEAGVRYLDWLAERFEENLPLVLAAYNAGEGVVDLYGGVPPYRETRDYIQRIYGLLEPQPPAAAEDASR